jgi:hypothetical protein
MSVELAGLYVFPCRNDKTPAVAGGFKSATIDPKIIDGWRRCPLMGAPTGACNGFDVLDIDRGGEDWLSLYETQYSLPPTRIVATRSGGLHIYFQHRVGMKCSAGLLAPNVDIRSTGGYVILWNLAGCRLLSEAPIAPWPGPMLRLLDEAEEARRERYAKPPSSYLVGASLVAQPQAEVPKPLYFMAARLTSCPRDKRRVIGILRGLVWLRERRNQALFDTAVCLRKALVESGIIARTSAAQLLFLTSQLNGYVNDHGADRAWKTINSGLGPKDINDAPTRNEGEA